MHKILPVFVLGLWSFSALSAPFTATLYEKDSNRAKAIFTLARTETVNGSKVSARTAFKDIEGKDAVREEIETDGGKVVHYKLDHLQLGESGTIDVRDGKVFFTWTKDGKTKTNDEDYPDNFAIGPTLVSYLQAHWNTILNGDDVDVRYGVADRRETVGFKFFKIGETKFDGIDAVQVKMKPKSFIIAAIVDPLIFTMDKKTGRLLDLVGRTLPKRKEGEKFKDLDVEIVYKY